MARRGSRHGLNVMLAICTAGEVFGGVERHVLGLCEYACRRGERPLLLLFYEGELAAQVRRLGVDPVILRGAGRYDPRHIRTVAETLDHHGVAVVHAHGYQAMIALAFARGWLRRRGRAAPVIVKTEHGRLEPMEGNPARWARLWLYRAADVAATRASAHAVCYVTSDLAAAYARLHKRLRRVVIANGIDPLDRSAFPRPAELEARRAHVGIIGRIAQVKGIEFALRAMASPRMPEQTVLNIIGTGPQEARLRREAETLGLGDRVRFLGFRRDVWRYLSHFDALLLPSLHEGLPYTLLESMSLQTPIIASRVGGLAEVLRDGETGLLFTPGDVGQLADLIARVISDPAWAREIGARAADEQRRALTLDQMGGSYWTLYAAAAGHA